MNILFFLRPKSEVAFIEDYFTLRQALEKMEYHKYSAIPILNSEGEYFGTITEGDILWYTKDKKHMNIQISEEISILDIPRRVDYTPVVATSNIEQLISRAMNQNFVPVIDDCNKFIGIITRKDIIEYCYKHMAINEI